ncbi:hypothetical protein [Enterobacter pseudoroggenkampii]|uniref:hypothetical protein n=1 Tax=Enterobacter pseudoroggenkampii TaxID=2996112 RepID=UPI002264E2C5|nr:hypothetical protein [Enterobacter pseudoroggenkampii]MCX8289110.1 hypothetical protein [Enterobacter pseudoroggenkampii]
MLTNNQMQAIASFNKEEGLLEAVINEIRERYSKEWLASKEEHFKQREALFIKALVLDDVIKIIRSVTNQIKFD